MQISAGASQIQLLHGSQSQIQEAVEHLAANMPTELTSPTSSSNNQEPSSPSAAHPSSEPGIVIHATMGYNRCRSMCPCQCHAPLIYTTPRILRNIFGSWFMMLSNISALKMRQCDYHRCYKTKESRFRLSYYFPTWVLGRTISIFGSYTSLPGAGANIAIRMPRVQPDDAVFFRYLETANLDGVRALLSSRQASPFDMTCEGRTALWVC